MAQIELLGTQYDSFASIAEADSYLAADSALWSVWSAREDDDKARGLISATRYLAALRWVTDPVASDPPAAVRDATAVLGALIAQNPSLVDGASPGRQIKRVGGAGVPTVEYFGPESERQLPRRITKMLAGLLSSSSGGASGSGHYSAGNDPSLIVDTDPYGLTEGIR